MCNPLHWIFNTSICSTFLLGKVSHKDVKDSTNWLFKAYYGNRMFMAYCCVACEVIMTYVYILPRQIFYNVMVSTALLIRLLILQVLYITLFLLAQNDSEKLMDVSHYFISLLFIHFKTKNFSCLSWF